MFSKANPTAEGVLDSKGLILLAQEGDPIETCTD